MGDYDAYGVPAPVAEAPPRPTSPGQSEEVRIELLKNVVIGAWIGKSGRCGRSMVLL